MDQNWYIWLYATNTVVALDADSEALLTALPVEAQTVNESAWLKVSIESMGSDEQPIGQEIERMGGYSVHPVTYKQTYEVRCAPFVFPDDMTALRSLRQICKNKQYLWVCRDGEGQAEGTKYPDPFHSGDRAMCCSLTGSKTASDDDKGLKEYSFTIRRKKPLS